MAISGLYRGDLTTSGGSTQRLELRIDVDKAIANGAVTKRVSGDLFRVDHIAVPGKAPQETEVYQESWILEAPQVKTTAAGTTIAGTIRYWNGVHPKTTVSIDIPAAKNAPATVTLLRGSLPPTSFPCAPAGTFFRSVHLEVDVCKSVNAAPTLPSYDTQSLKERPPGTAKRTLTIERSYAEAGVELAIRGDKRTIVDDTAPGFQAWSDAELHNAMEHHFSQYGGTWPKWEIWGLLAGEYQDSLIGGIMFDYAAALGGAGKPPERQGFAVFRKHFWFDDLVAQPKTQAQLEATRKFLYTFVHEAGHTFNLEHSWVKSRPNALSWMNYDWMYEDANPGSSFWKVFPFVFDDEELGHIRHGNRASVIMGGDPFASGGHLEAPPGAEMMAMPPGALVSADGPLPLEIKVRSQGYFEFLEPVSVEVRARNLLATPVTVHSALHPESGSVTLYIRRPDGRVVEYMPVECKVAPLSPVTLSPAGAEDHSDRHSRTVFVSYGRYGFYFDEPGQYLVRAVYNGPGNMTVPSDVCSLRVGHPRSAREDRLAQDYFSYESGVSLYLGGSQSKFVGRGMDVLLSMVDEQRTTLAAAKTAARIARGVGLPFHDLDFEDGRAPVMRRTGRGDARQALKLTDVALRVFRRHRSPALNIPIERAGRTRADMLMRLGEPERARDELTALARTLSAGGVKPSAVERVQQTADEIAVAASPRRAARSPRRPTSRR